MSIKLSIFLHSLSTKTIQDEKQRNYPRPPGSENLQGILSALAECMAVHEVDFGFADLRIINSAEFLFSHEQTLQVITD
jgi:hypothetical protein